MDQGRELSCHSFIELLVDDVYIKRGNIEIASRNKNTKLTFRDFQDELVQVLGKESSIRYIAVEAPTGGGKTFAMLAPLISNVLFDTRYVGVAGVYPTKPLVNDQFISLRSTLDKLGARIEEVSSGDGYEVAIKYALEVEVVDKRTGTRETANATVGLVRLTRESLDRLQGILENASGRLSLLDLIRRSLLDTDYIIAIAVPEYPYLMLSLLYRSIPDAQRILSLAAEEGFAYSLAKEIASSQDIIWRLRSELMQLLQQKRVERERLDIYSALFSEIMFLDEFHIWTVYERPTVLALVLLHYLESMRSATPERYKVIFSSATPQREFYDLLRRLNLGEVKVISATIVNEPSNADRVKSKTLVRFVPCPTKSVSGAVSWFKLEDHIPSIVEAFADAMKSRERAIVFARRDAVVEEAAECFHMLTREEPVVVTGIKTRFLGKELLEQRREQGRLFVFGNYSIELGIDLRKIPFGIVYGVYLGEIVQRLGRIGRGDVNQVEVILPVPSSYAPTVKRLVEEHGGRVSYGKLIELLSWIMPEKLGIEAFGTEFVMKHNVGKLRVYLPLATYVLTLVALWEYVEELRKLCQKFVGIADALGIPSIFPWLRKVSKSASVLVPIASFRVAASVPYVRDGIEDYASLSTLLGNYNVEYINGKLFIRGVSKKSLQSVLCLQCRYLPSSLFDTVMPSNLLLTLIKNCIESSRDSVVYKVLKDYPIPVYVMQSDEGEVYQVFNAFGYAVSVELTIGGGVFYLLLL